MLFPEWHIPRLHVWSCVCNRKNRITLSSVEYSVEASISSACWVCLSISGSRCGVVDFDIQLYQEHTSKLILSRITTRSTVATFQNTFFLVLICYLSRDLSSGMDLNSHSLSVHVERFDRWTLGLDLPDLWHILSLCLSILDIHGAVRYFQVKQIICRHFAYFASLGGTILT